ncbi:MAG: hypothetical protein QXF28_02330 [Nitrososphaerota archaeon]
MREVLTRVRRCERVGILREIVNIPKPNSIYDENTPRMYNVPKIKIVDLSAPKEYESDMKRARRLKLHIFNPSKTPKNRRYR